MKTGLTRFLPARLAAESAVEPVTWQGSGIWRARAAPTVSCVVPPDQPLLAAGETVTILLG